MNLARLFPEQGQSAWLDNLRRDSLVDGSLQRAITAGIRGLTSNPTIFQKAITGSTLYDEQFADALSRGLSVEDAYWELVTSDIVSACDLFAGVYESSKGVDGYVSVEVSPSLCHDAGGTIKAARELWKRVNRPNVMIKIPATDAGLEAITTVLSEGINVNVTLIFGIERYRQVAGAHQQGLELLAKNDETKLTHVASVASFFISRVDNAIDPLLEGSDVPVGRTAIAQAKLAYQEFLLHLQGPSWTALSTLGAQAQRPLWASTSTKNPAFSSTLYVDELIGPLTVNTLPDPTIEAFERSGTVGKTLDRDVESAREHLEQVKKAGIDVESIARKLEIDGLTAFQSSFDELLSSLEFKAASH
ncbi:MAG: transaldolase [Actinobacteria bacterium]|nr:transaldolase [Actinomycetota bacterium]